MKNPPTLENNGATVRPPVARRDPQVSELHGERRVDEYAWMRNKKDPAVIAYLEAENAYAAAVMKPTEAFQDSLYQEMLGRIQQTDLTVPYREGGYFYYSRTVEGKQYPIRCRKKESLDAPEEILLDGNELARGHKFFALGAITVSDDGNLLAYSTDFTGFREYTLRVKDLRSGELLPEEIEKTDSAEWAADNRTLFYTVEDSAKRSYRLYRHILGARAAADELIYEETDERFHLSVWRSRSKQYLFLSSDSHTASEVRFCGAGETAGAWRVVAGRETDHEYDLDHHGGKFYILSNRSGRNFALFTAPVSDPAPGNWQEILPHRPAVMLTGIELFAKHLVVLEREDGLPQMRVANLETGEAHRVEFPEPAYSAWPTENYEFDIKLFRFQYQSLITPPSVFDYDLDSRERTLLKQTPVLGGYDPANYCSERLHATAADGTRIPLSVVYRKGRARDGSAPLLLSGYGAYGIPLPVTFSSRRLSLLDRGFVVALAHVRGGGELGKPWHDQGRMLHKRNTFTDFIAAAEFLVAQKFTSRDRLMIEGGSAGGLLIGAVLNERPDLVRAAVMQVPFVDVLNSMLDSSLPLTVGEFEEWGDPRRPEEYAAMRAYCPYTNLAAREYPAMLVKTSLNDSQVMYWEPAKYTARLRTLKTDTKPLLFKTNLAAGHGGASGRYDYLREVAHDYAFLLWCAGVSS
jgi:oligopeptidase B